MEQKQAGELSTVREVQSYRGDEVDLAALVAVLWQGKWLVVLITLICTALCLVYLFLKPPIYKGFLDVKPISTVELVRYGQLNQLDSFKVSPGGLLSELMMDLDDRTTFVEAIRESGIISSEGKTGAEYEREVIALAYDIRLIPPVSAEEAESRKGAKVKPYWSIEFETSSAELFRGVLREAIGHSSENVRHIQEVKYGEVLRLLKKKQQYAISNLNIRGGNLTEKYRDGINQRLAFLKEQADLARGVGIAKNALEAQEFVGRSSVLTSMESKTPFYMRGYKAIEKELELIKARKDDALHINELVEVKNELRVIETSKTIERLELAFEASPIRQGNFVAARYNVDGKVFERKDKRLLVLVLSVFLGGVLGIFAVFIRHGVRSYHARF